MNHREFICPPVLLAVLGLLTVRGPGRADQPTPSLSETLTWFHNLPTMGGMVNKGMDPMRFKKLTSDDLKTLKELQLGGHLVDGNGKTLPGHLSLPDADYRYLTALPALATLLFPETDLGDEALKHIGKISTLKRLVLMENKFTAAGLQHLTGLKELAQLDLRWNKQLDDAAVPYLVQFKQVRELTLFQTNISPDGIKRIQAALPNCKIVTTKTDWR